MLPAIDGYQQHVDELQQLRNILAGDEDPEMKSLAAQDVP